MVHSGAAAELNGHMLYNRAIGRDRCVLCERQIDDVPCNSGEGAFVHDRTTRMQESNVLCAARQWQQRSNRMPATPR